MFADLQGAELLLRLRGGRGRLRPVAARLLVGVGLCHGSSGALREIAVLGYQHKE